MYTITTTATNTNEISKRGQNPPNAICSLTYCKAMIGSGGSLVIESIRMNSYHCFKIQIDNRFINIFFIISNLAIMDRNERIAILNIQHIEICVEAKIESNSILIATINYSLKYVNL